MKIKKDIIGFYTKAGGWIARPENFTDFSTDFKENDIVNTYHYGGSQKARVNNKIYSEVWETSGLADYIYDYAKNHYFETEGEFNNFLLEYFRFKLNFKWDEVMELKKDIELEYWKYQTKKLENKKYKKGKKQ